MADVGSAPAPRRGLRIAICGLTITSSWGNGHATTYRALVKALAARGHDVVFFERNAPWYAENRDQPQPAGARTKLYGTLDELKTRHGTTIRDADVVIVGSYVPEGVELGEWVVRHARGVTAFYDIDTPITLRMLEEDDPQYLSRSLVERWDLYLSFTGGPTLERLEREFRAQRARALYCSVDPEVHRPIAIEPRFDLGYLGTYSDDRQPLVDELLVRPAERLPAARFAVAGPQYPASLVWPVNVARIEHLAPPEHARFYAEQRFTLNVTRRDMVRAGWSPSVRLFEAAASGVPIISDPWPGLDALFAIDEEIFVARRTSDVIAILTGTSDADRRALRDRARSAVLARHTAAHRAAELEGFVREVTHDAEVRDEERTAPPRVEA